MKLIIEIDEAMYKRICEAQSVPDMYGTDVVNAINRIKKGTPVELATNLQSACNNLQQRPQGQWIRTGSLGNGNAHYECSECHYGDEHAESQEVPYCWHCGADMRKGSKNETDN